MADFVSRSGLPRRVFNLMLGLGSIVGDALRHHDRVRGITFTGSVQTGSAVAAAGTDRGAKYQLEMGGKNPLIVLNDADIEIAVCCADNGAYFSTGQHCPALSRLIVETSIHDEFVSALWQTVGPSSAPAWTAKPMIRRVH